MTLLTNMRTILLENCGFLVKLGPKTHPGAPSGRGRKLKSDGNKCSCNMIKVNKSHLNDISDESESRNTRKTWIFGRISPENGPCVSPLEDLKSKNLLD